MAASTRAKRGVLGALALAAVLAVGGYALTNTITFEESSTLAGFGEQEVQVLEVTDIDYTLDATNKSEVDSLTFTLDSGILTGDGDGYAWVQINDSAAWETCGAVADAATTVVCDITDSPVTDVGTTTEEVKLVLAE